MHTTAASALRALRQLGDAERAAGAARFFKTGPGGYGEGDRFLGVPVLTLRKLVRACDLPLPEVERLLESPFNEARFLALLLMVRDYPKAPQATFELYLRRTDRIDNWNLVDASAEYVVGRHLQHGSRAVLRKLARSKHLWERRIAIVSTLHFIRQGDATDALAIAASLLRDDHDLIHKATGWMLREVGKRASEAALLAFLDAHAPAMPRTMLRYAIERLGPAQKTKYMQMPRVAARQLERT